MLNEKSKASDDDIDRTGVEGEETRSLLKKLKANGEEPVEISNKKLQYLE